MCAMPFEKLFPFCSVLFRFLLFRSSPKAEKARFAAAARTLRQLRAERESVSEAIPCQVALGPSLVGVSTIALALRPPEWWTSALRRRYKVREWHLPVFCMQASSFFKSETARNETKPNGIAVKNSKRIE